MIKKIFKVISDTLFIFLLMALIIAFYSWVQISLMHKPYSSFFGYSIFEVVTGSMSGTIEIDDYIIVKEQKDYKLKDIITFKDGTSIVTHRIVEIRGNTFITRGDANNLNDIEISKNNIIGKVVLTIRNGSIWKKVFTDYKVLIFIILTMLLFSFYFSFDEDKDEKKEKKKEKKIVKEIEEVKEDIKELKEEIKEVTEKQEEIEEEKEEKPKEEPKKKNKPKYNPKPYYKTAKYRQNKAKKKQK